jgi:hypothetical protein
MQAFTPTSASPIHYSKEAIGFLVAGSILALIICIAWAYIHHKGGPKEILRADRESRKAQREACDIEMAQAESHAKLAAIYENQLQQRRAQNKKVEEEKEVQEAAQELINAVMIANGLVGSVVTPPQRVDFGENFHKEFDGELHAPGMKQMHVQHGKVVREDSMDLSVEPVIDPMSFMVGRGKHMAVLYR